MPEEYTDLEFNVKTTQRNPLAMCEVGEVTVKRTNDSDQNNLIPPVIINNNNSLSQFVTKMPQLNENAEDQN
jgi:hypothetical protein